MGRLVHDFRRRRADLKFCVLLLLSHASTTTSEATVPTFNAVPNTDTSAWEGSTLTLKCPLAESSFDVEWYRDGQATGRTSLLLNIPRLSRIDSGLYRCLASGDNGQAFSPAFNVTVLYLDRFETKPLSFFSVRANPAAYFILKPPPLVQSGSLDLSWKWFFNSQEVFTNDTHFVSAHGDLLVLKAQQSFGTYRVEVSTQNGRVISDEYTVKPDDSVLAAAPPFSVVYHPKDTFVVSRASSTSAALFECVPSWDRFPVEIKWFLNGDELNDPHARFELSNRRLVLTNPAALLPEGAHSAKISCQATASDGFTQDRAEAHLEAYETPKISRRSLPEQLSRIIGTSAKLVCRTERSWPRARLSWYFNGEPIDNATNEVFLLSSLRKDQFGVYQCIASNKVGTDIAQTWLKIGEDSSNEEPAATDVPEVERRTLVKSAAQVVATSTSLIEYGPTSQSLLIGSNIRIPCKTSSSGRNIVVAWYKEGHEIGKAGDRARRISLNADNSLSINQVGPDSVGNYTCMARTADGDEESASGRLEIIEKPGMPVGVAAELVNNTVPAKVRVSWVQGFDGNSPIIKHGVEMRTVGPTGLWSEWETAVDNVPSEMCCSAFVDNLKPSATAEFRVVAYNRHGRGMPSKPSLNVTMPQQPPAAAPRNVVASPRSSSSIVVQWQPPPAEQWNGDILGYHIRYRLSGYATADWNEKNVSKPHARNALIEPLITWREYEIQVAAFNDRGLGVYSKPVTVTTLEDVPMQAPQNVEVRVLNSTDIQVSFVPPDQQMIPGVNLGYKIELWKGEVGSGRLFKRVRVDPEFGPIATKIGGLEKFGHYNLTVNCFTAPGDGPRSTPIVVVTDEDLPGPVASVNFDQVMFSSVVVLFERPTEPNGVILKYIIRHWKTDEPVDKRSMEVSASETSVTIEELIASTSYSVDIQAVTKAGAGPRVEAKFESGVPPELPGRPSSLTVTDIGSRSAQLQFVPGFDGHSFIRRWIVEARVGSSSIYTTVFNTSAPKARAFTVEVLRPYTKYQLRLIAENVRGRGAPSDPAKPFETHQTDPEMPPQNVYAEPLSSSDLSVVWTPLPPAHWNGEPVGYLLKYRAAKQHSLVELDDDDPTAWHEVRVNNPKASELKLTQLKPFMSYQIQVLAANTFGRSKPSETVFATTYEDVPSGAPRSVAASLGSEPMSANIQWDDLADDEKNGVVLGFKVRLSRDDAMDSHDALLEADVPGADARSFAIKGLLPFASYRVTVVAYTLVGDGPRNSDAPVLTTPEDVPSAPRKLLFNEVTNETVKPLWEPPEHPNGRIEGYNIRYWRFGQSENQAVNTAAPASATYTANGLSPSTTYVFCVKAQTTIGWGPEACADVLTTTARVKLPLPPQPEQNKAKEQSSDAIWIRWSGGRVPGQAALTEAESPPRATEVQYQKANEDGWTRFEQLVPPSENLVRITELLPNTAYRVRIRFLGDGYEYSSWSSESNWIKTSEAPPAKPPDQVQVRPYESNSALLQWTAPKMDSWNSDHVDYRIRYRIYPSNDSYRTEEVEMKDAMSANDLLQYTLSRLASFHHYVVQMETVNHRGSSPASRPVFVYVGYSIPKQAIEHLEAESTSSTSIRVRWDKWKSSDDDVISGYRVRYTPLLSTLSSEIRSEAEGGESTEEILVTEKNEVVLSDLRKFTEYQISVAGYNRAGEGQPSVTRVRTLEDVPGPVGDLLFRDILLDSVNVSWSPPQQPNGRIQWYIVNYRTYKMSDEFRKEIQQKTALTYLLATNLEEGVTYYFAVRAETSAGLGAETVGNVTIAQSVGAPDAPDRPLVVPEQSTFLLRWEDGGPGNTPIKGHIIQAKRTRPAPASLSTSFNESAVSIRRSRRQAVSAELLSDSPPRHTIGEWFTISSVLGTDSQYRISYRQLEPSSYYVFRLYARNELGVGHPSSSSEELYVPATIPEDPFYTKWWFLVIIALLILIVVVIFIATLCITSSSSKYKSEKNHAFDTLQLSDGGIVSYELQSKRMKRNEPHLRPETHNTWISDEQLRDPVTVYGSIASGISGTAPVNSMYRALNTDTVPGTYDASYRNSIQPNYQPEQPMRAEYASRNQLASGDSPTSEYHVSNFNAGNRFSDAAGYGLQEPQSIYGRSVARDSIDDDEPDRSFARHYEFSHPTDDVYHATWRRNREQALPPPPISRPPRPESSVSSNGTQSGIPEQALPPPLGLLRASHSTDFASPSNYAKSTVLAENGASIVNGLSSFV